MVPDEDIHTLSTIHTRRFGILQDAQSLLGLQAAPSHPIRDNLRLPEPSGHVLPKNVDEPEDQHLNMTYWSLIPRLMRSFYCRR